MWDVRSTDWHWVSFFPVPGAPHSLTILPLTLSGVDAKSVVKQPSQKKEPCLSNIEIYEWNYITDKHLQVAVKAVEMQLSLLPIAPSLQMLAVSGGPIAAD
jgi:hypothetical protein